MNKHANHIVLIDWGTSIESVPGNDLSRKRLSHDKVGYSWIPIRRAREKSVATAVSGAFFDTIGRPQGWAGGVRQTPTRKHRSAASTIRIPNARDWFCEQQGAPHERTDQGGRLGRRAGRTFRVDRSAASELRTGADSHPG
jgi:hypothetical protein